jgi:drug/metabolite transporter (DMT)-like permease
MTITLAIIGGILIVLNAVSRIPLAVSALIRACIPVVTAVHDLRQASRGCGNLDDGE